MLVMDVGQLMFRCDCTVSLQLVVGLRRVVASANSKA